MARFFVSIVLLRIAFELVVASSVANDVHTMMIELANTLLPPEVSHTVLRDYGQTADEKVNNLTSSLVFAVFTVVIFVGVFLGWRPAVVVGLAVPICYGITLSLDFAFGYTINRVTLFALILSLGTLSSSAPSARFR